MSASDADQAKRRAAERAADLVRPGMKLGLGTGSTAAHFVDCIGALVRDGMPLICVPTSEQTGAQALRLGIPLTTLDETPALDLTVDGADEFDPQLRLIKGAGGALLREKIVAAASARMVVIADRSKQVETLGRFPLPIEIVSFGAEATRRAIVTAAATAGCAGELTLRHGKNGRVFVTDEGHHIFDAAFGAIPDPDELASRLSAIPGVVEHGLFIRLAQAVIVADPAGVDIIGDLG